jgi:hypothetical protein
MDNRVLNFSQYLEDLKNLYEDNTGASYGNDQSTKGKDLPEVTVVSKKAPIKSTEQDAINIVDSSSVFFIEALNCLDQLFSIVISIELDTKKRGELLDDYIKSVKQLGDNVSPSFDSIKDMWSTISKISNDMRPAANDKIKESPIIKELQTKIKELTDQKNSGALSADDYNGEVKSFKDKAIAAYKEDPFLLNIADYGKASSLFVSAINKFSMGAMKELERVEDLGSDSKKKNCYEDITDFVKRVTSKSRNIKTAQQRAKERNKAELAKAKGEDAELDSKVRTSAESGDDGGPKVTIGKTNEDFGGFLNKAREFVSNVGKGVGDLADKTVFGGGDSDEGELNANLILSKAESVKSTILAASSKIDNIIAFQKNVTGNVQYDKEGNIVKTKQEKGAEEAGADMIKFMQDSFKYVIPENIQKELKSSTLSSINKKLDSIAKELKIIMRPGGTLDKWADGVMGEKRESVISSGYLSQGKSLEAQANEALAKVIERKYLNARIKARSATAFIKKGVELVTGKKEETEGKPSLIRKAGETKKSYKTFPPKPGKGDSDAIKEFQQRLKGIEYLKTDHSEGSYDTDTQNATTRAMHYISAITGKVYSTEEKAFREFQEDLGIYTDNKDKITKKLGLTKKSGK